MTFYLLGTESTVMIPVAVTVYHWGKKVCMVFSIYF